MPPRAPSAALLRAILPSASASSSLSSQCLRQQARAHSNWMPPRKYRTINRLDKLHRRQRDAKVQERLDSQTRANAMSFYPPTPISTTAPDLAAASANPVAPATTTQIQLPYIIARTPSAQLPVYEHAKGGGGTKHITVLRKLSGDLNALQIHLRDALGLAEGFTDNKGRKKEYVSVNWTTQHIVIRGWRAAEVKRWCELAGF